MYSVLYVFVLSYAAGNMTEYHYSQFDYLVVVFDKYMLVCGLFM